MRLSATIATAVNRCNPVLAEGVGGAVGMGGAVRGGGPSLRFTAGPVQRTHPALTTVGHAHAQMVEIVRDQLHLGEW